MYFAERMAVPPQKEKKVLFLIWVDDAGREGKLLFS